MDPVGRAASLRWDEHGVPYSADFNDQYFCRDSGYEEAVHVCCHGNMLAGRFASLDSSEKGVFTIIETGFGTGLDFCCACQLWDLYAPGAWSLHFLSVELFPLSVEDIDRALGRWPQLSDHRRELVARYRPMPGQIGAWDFGGRRVRLTIVFDDAAAALGRIRAEGLAPRGADAWFLDGFAPSKNPAMWSDAVFAQVGLLSREGTTFSTYTAAGFVRRGLEKTGFAVRKIPGHGRKKEMIAGSFRGNENDA